MFAARCFLTLTDSPENRQKTANDFFYLVNSCLLHSASWVHFASSDVPELSDEELAARKQTKNNKITRLAHEDPCFISERRGCT